MADATATVKREVGTVDGQPYIKYGTHIDTLSIVDEVFAKQRKLSFMYGAAFFAVTLAIPAMSVWVEGWYSVEVWGGFTLNYLVVGLLYFAFLWIMAWTYAKQADRIEEELMHRADEMEKHIMGKLGGDAS